MDAFFTTAFMGNYSEAVFIEGDCPIDFVDLSVFVAPAPAKGRSLLRRVAGSAPRPDFHGFHAVPGELDALVRLLGGGGPPKQQRARGARGAAKSKGSGVLAFPGPAPAEHWAVEERYAGIERAQLVVSNARSDAERRAVASVLEDLSRIRLDDEVRRDVLGRFGHKTPITAVIADLSDPKDAGLKKALARVKRTTKRRSQ